MEVKLKNYQDKFVFASEQFPAMISAWATGKTLCGILRALLYSEHIKENLGVIFRKEFVDLRDSTIQDFEKYTKYKVDSQRNVIINDSKIMFRHIEELNNIQNINLGWFMIEQIDELETDNEFIMLWGRLRRKVEPDEFFKTLGLPERSGFVVGNVGKGWVKDRWKDNLRKRHCLSEANTFDNADVLVSDYLENLQELETDKPEVYQRFVMNNWDIEDDAFILIPVKKIEELKNIHFYDTIVGDLISCDPSRGGDECAIYIMRNSKIIESKFIYEKDPMKIAGELMVLGARHNIDNFVNDNIGNDIGYRLQELKKNVTFIESAKKSIYSKQFVNMRTEMWWYVMKRIFDKELPYPEDAELRRQLSSVRYRIVNSSGLMQLEHKQETKLRLGRSPDRADAFVYGIWATQFLDPRNQMLKPYNYRTGKSETSKVDELQETSYR